jgi:hypothetical protein
MSPLPELPATSPATGAFVRVAAGHLRRLRSWMRDHPTAVTAAGSLVVGGALVIALFGKRGEFAAALGAAPLWILGIAVLLHLVWLVARSEAWHVCVGAAGGNVHRRRLYRAASIGYLGNLFNGQFGLAVRIAALRRSAPRDSPAPKVLVAPSCRWSSSRSRSPRWPRSRSWGRSAFPGGCP